MKPMAAKLHWTDQVLFWAWFGVQWWLLLAILGPPMAAALTWVTNGASHSFYGFVGVLMDMFTAAMRGTG